jgi:hypothetical protein
MWSIQVKETYTPPPPSNLGLPDDGRRYTYGTFPKLQAELFGKTRPPRKWHSDRRSNRRASMVKHQTEQAVYFQAMAPMLQAGSILRSATKRGTKSLESALGALSNAFDVSTRPADKSPSTSSYSSSFLNRSLHSYASAYSKHASSAFTSERHQYNPRLSSEIVSSAEKLIINARRKQSILIEIFGVFQAHQKLIRGSLANDSFESGLEALGLTTPSTKTFSISAADGAIALQSSYRGFVARRAFRRARMVAFYVQSFTRGRRTRWVFQLLRVAIVRLQALARGFVVRKLLAVLVEGRLDVYRKHIFHLWQRDHTPLAYRSNFWFIVQFSGILQLGIAEDEICRLWHAINIPLQSISSDKTLERHWNDSLFTVARRLSVRTQVYLQAIEVSFSKW